MTKKREQLNCDRLVDPSRRELRHDNIEINRLVGFLGGGIWSIPAEEIAQASPYPDRRDVSQTVAVSPAP
ncbi:hypothetical protein [Brenneria rubrifaciens]|uniref:Uncharacterized protein n=1 Tax=Brenneria rubrifaciens TaxID=55213 RepID=A0A4P8QR68_9GAMM|nr:hypothetical protein [Brenneria rubrifaciens]QCR09611.1 hypothetical protein EH207_14430 [Brenneria rubrifaciens]